MTPETITAELIGRCIARIDTLEARILAMEVRRSLPMRDKQLAVREAIKIRDIAAAVALEYEVSLAALKGRDRTAKICRARQHAFLLAQEAGHSSAKIGRYFDRDHSTVLVGASHAKARRDALA